MPTGARDRKEDGEQHTSLGVRKVNEKKKEKRRDHKPVWSSSLLPKRA